MKKMLMVPMLLSLLAGCLPLTNMPGTIKAEMNDPAFQNQNYPKRGLKVVVICNPNVEKEVLGKIGEAFTAFDQQTGIYAQEIKVVTVGARTPTTVGTLNLMFRELKKERDFDIAIFYTKGLYVDDLMIPAGMIWFGKIDDTYRKYIITRSLSKWVLMHEIAHAFIFNHGHGTCLMMSGLFVAPFCHYLGKDDWQEVQRNKWRDFSQKPELRAEDRQDVIKE
jgi:hypothetical protein